MWCNLTRLRVTEQSLEIGSASLCRAATGGYGICGLGRCDHLRGAWLGYRAYALFTRGAGSNARQGDPLGSMPGWTLINEAATPPRWDLSTKLKIVDGELNRLPSSSSIMPS